MLHLQPLYIDRPSVRFYFDSMDDLFKAMQQLIQDAIEFVACSVSLNETEPDQVLVSLEDSTVWYVDTDNSLISLTLDKAKVHFAV